MPENVGDQWRAVFGLAADVALVEEAKYRYLHDPTWHAVVDTAVEVAVREVYRRTKGGVVQPHERNDMTMAVAVWLAVLERQSARSSTPAESPTVEAGSICRVTNEPTPARWDIGCDACGGQPHDRLFREYQADLSTPAESPARDHRASAPTGQQSGDSGHG